MAITQIKFPIGTRVIKTNDCYYSHSGDKSGVSIGTKGTVVDVRSRYVDTKNEYHLYIVKFDDIDLNENSLYNQYDMSSLTENM
jgi:hypothetical protein